MKIDSIELPKYPLFLAPMEDVSDPCFRKLCKQNGVDFMYTEFISADGLIRGGRKGLQKLNIYEYERPIGIQIYGHLIDAMVEAARIVEQANPDLIDINFGCPVKKIANRGAGSGMLKDVPKMVEMTRQIVQAVKLPVTVKTRLGWDHDSIQIVDVAERLQDVGIKAISIHGRTRSQMYNGESDWDPIGQVKNNPSMHIPVIGNGDIKTPQDAKEKFDKYGVDGIMIGRGSIGQPDIFRRIREYLASGNIPQENSIEAKISMVKEHLEESVKWKGERVGVIHMRRHYVNYFKGLHDFREMKIRLLTSTTHAENLAILDEIRYRYREEG